MGIWAESSERQFTKEGQMTTKHGKRTIASSQTNPRTRSTRSPSWQQRRRRRRHSPLPAPSRPLRWSLPGGRAQVRGQGVPALGARVCHWAPVLLPRMQVWGSSQQGFQEASTEAAFLAHCCLHEQHAGVRHSGPEFQQGARETARVRRAMKTKTGLEEWDSAWLG